MFKIEVILPSGNKIYVSSQLTDAVSTYNGVKSAFGDNSCRIFVNGSVVMAGAMSEDYTDIVKSYAEG